MRFDWTQRITGAAGLLLLAYFAAHTAQLLNQKKEAASQDHPAQRSSVSDAKTQAGINAPKVEKKEQAAKKKDGQGDNSQNIGSVSQGSGSAFSIGQQGGVTAGTYIGTPPPQFSISKVSENVKQGSSYETKFRVQVVASQPVTFHVRVTAQHIEDVTIDNERPPEQGGMAFQSTNQAGDGWLQNNYMNMESGSYFIIVYTHLPQEIQLACW
jgi:hypothetical protein